MNTLAVICIAFTRVITLFIIYCSHNTECRGHCGDSPRPEQPQLNPTSTTESEFCRKTKRSPFLKRTEMLQSDGQKQQTKDDCHIVRNNKAKGMPAMAAARGVLSWRWARLASKPPEPNRPITSLKFSTTISTIRISRLRLEA